MRCRKDARCVNEDGHATPDGLATFCTNGRGGYWGGDVREDTDEKIERLEATIAKLRGAPERRHDVRVDNIAGDHVKLMVNGYGVCQWSLVTCPDGEDVEAYADEAARVLRQALAAPPPDAPKEET